MKLFTTTKIWYTGCIKKNEDIKYIFEVSLIETYDISNKLKQKTFLISSDDDIIEEKINSFLREKKYKYFFKTNIFWYGKVSKKLLKKFQKNTISSFEDIVYTINNF